MSGKRERGSDNSSPETPAAKKSNIKTKMNMEQIGKLIKTTLRDELKVQSESYKSLNETILVLLTKFENLSEQIKIERESFVKEKSELVERIESLEKRLRLQERSERKRNIVVRGLIGEELKGKEVNNSSIEDFIAKEIKVVAKIREVVKVIPDKDLVIVELDTFADKEKIMRSKKVLRDSGKFKTVFLDEDRSFEERRRRAVIRQHVNNYEIRARLFLA